MVGLHPVVVTVKHLTHSLEGLWVRWDQGEELHEPRREGSRAEGSGGGISM